MWEKLKRSSSSKMGKLLIAGDHQDEQQVMVQERNVVDEEYNQALHTKSFMELYSKVHDHDHHHLNRSTTINPNSTLNTKKDRQKVALHHSHSLEPTLDQSLYPDTIISTNSSNNGYSCSTTSRNLHCHVNTLLLDFFDTTSKSFAACASLLSSITRARSHHRSIRRLLLHTTSPPSKASISKLSSYLNLPNPLSPQNLSRFHQVHSYYPTLICQLTSTHRKIIRRLKWWFVGLVKVERSAGKKVDAAARGAYIIGTDMDTMDVMLRRVHDELEHGRDLARMVVRNRDMWEGLVKEMMRREVGMGLEEQLKELEEHVFLCLVTISRSRRFVAKEIHEDA